MKLRISCSSSYEIGAPETQPGLALILWLQCKCFCGAVLAGIGAAIVAATHGKRPFTRFCLRGAARDSGPDSRNYGREPVAQSATHVRAKPLQCLSVRGANSHFAYLLSRGAACHRLMRLPAARAGMALPGDTGGSCFNQLASRAANRSRWPTSQSTQAAPLPVELPAELTVN